MEPLTLLHGLLHDGLPALLGALAPSHAALRLEGLQTVDPQFGGHAPDELALLTGEGHGKTKDGGWGAQVLQGLGQGLFQPQAIGALQERTPATPFPIHHLTALARGEPQHPREVVGLRGGERHLLGQAFTDGLKGMPEALAAYSDMCGFGSTPCIMLT